MTLPKDRRQQTHNLLHLLQESISLVLLLIVAALILLVPLVPLAMLILLGVFTWSVNVPLVTAGCFILGLVWTVVCIVPMYQSFYIEVIQPELPVKQNPTPAEKPKPVMTFEEEQRLNQAVYDTRNEY